MTTHAGSWKELESCRYKRKERESKTKRKKGKGERKKERQLSVVIKFLRMQLMGQPSKKFEAMFDH